MSDTRDREIAELEAPILELRSKPAAPEPAPEPEPEPERDPDGMAAGWAALHEELAGRSRSPLRCTPPAGTRTKLTSGCWRPATESAGVQASAPGQETSCHFLPRALRHQSCCQHRPRLRGSSRAQSRPARSAARIARLC